MINLDSTLQHQITAEQAWHYSILPKHIDEKTIELYIDELKADKSIENELEILFGKIIQFHPQNTSSIQNALSKYYHKAGIVLQSHQNKYLTSIKKEEFINTLIQEADSFSSSDIHIEPHEDKGRIRFRIDGQLIEKYLIHKNEYSSVINKIKIKANLDIAEKRLPQDGRIFFSSENQKFDIRVSSLPTLYGEKIVLRLLSKDASTIDINKLGFRENELENYLLGIKNPHGILLISGPTGSGKTTTLYATLKLLNKEKTNVLTIEDPIEYTLEGINQVQLKENIGLTYTSALRTFLRQDPDVIMLGEIRDADTAQMAIRAALTGHLVLSTIHTNSAWGTISRLIDMKIAPFLIANTLTTTVAQRLLRLLCNECKEQIAFNQKSLPPNYPLKTKIENQYTAKGCPNCFFTGYKGRKAIYEVITVDSEISELIKNNTYNIDETLSKRNIKKLHQNAFELFCDGLTSAEEIYPILLNPS
jgi:type IV pilus assembly protein PilB